jgi:hypothetical protein
MKKYVLIISVCFCFSGPAMAGRYLGLGTGPNFGLMNTKTTNLMFDFDWLAHNTVGTKVSVGFFDGFWVGTGFTVNVSTDPAYKAPWYVTANFSVPLMINIHGNDKNMMIGFMVGSTCAFSLGSRRKYYMYVKPLEVFFVPATWQLSPGGNVFSNALRIYFSAQVGLRMNI